jgi:hypothetical protein
MKEHLSDFNVMLHTRGRAAALDALMDYLDGMVVTRQASAIDFWLKQELGDATQVADEVLLCVLVALYPLKNSLTMYVEFLELTRATIANRSGTERAERLLRSNNVV